MATLLVGKIGFEPISSDPESKIIYHYTISQFVKEVGLEPTSISSKLICPALDDSSICCPVWIRTRDKRVKVACVSATPRDNLVGMFRIELKLKVPKTLVITIIPHSNIIKTKNPSTFKIDGSYLSFNFRQYSTCQPFGRFVAVVAGK